MQGWAAGALHVSADPHVGQRGPGCAAQLLPPQDRGAGQSSYCGGFHSRRPRYDSIKIREFFSLKDLKFCMHIEHGKKKKFVMTNLRSGAYKTR